MMREDDGNLCAASDLECFGNAIKKSDTFFAQVRCVDAAACRCFLGQGDDFVDGGVVSGHIPQSGAQPEGPFAHCLCNHPLHPRKFGCGGRAILGSHHLFADGVVSREIGDVHAEPGMVCRIEICAEWPRPPAVGTAQRKGDALAHRTLGAGELQQWFEMRVQIDESGCDDQPCCVDNTFGVGDLDRRR